MVEIAVSRANFAVRQIVACLAWLVMVMPLSAKKTMAGTGDRSQSD
jgi:hypothetical protein